MLNELSKKYLHQIGWFDGRRVDTTISQKIITANGFLLNEYAINFINEFDGLSLSSQREKNSNYLDFISFDIKSVINHFFPDWANNLYKPILNESLCLVGMANGGYLALYISDTGKLYGGFDDFLELLGLDYYSGLNNLFEKNNIKIIDTR